MFVTGLLQPTQFQRTCDRSLACFYTPALLPACPSSLGLPEVKLDYSEPGWPRGKSAPYQVELDQGPLIYAPVDSARTGLGPGNKPGGARSDSVHGGCLYS